MAIIVVTGAYFNTLARVASGQVVVSPAAMSGYPLAQLHDGFTSRPFRFGSIQTDATITVDGNLVLNGNMSTDNGGNVASWTEANNGGGSDVTRTTTGGEYQVAPAGMKLVCGAGGGSFASAYQDIRCRPGEVMLAHCYLRGNGSSPMRLRVQNLASGSFLTAGLGWQSAATDVFTRTPNTFAEFGPSAFTVQSYSACGYRDYVTLRVTALNNTLSATMYADEVFVWPGTSWVSIHGHNITPVVAVEWRESTDGFGANDVLVATMAQYRPAFGVSAAGNNRRWNRVEFSGTPLDMYWIGELVMSQGLQLARGPSYGVTFTMAEAQLRQMLSLGDVLVFALGELEQRRVVLPYRLTTDANYQEWRDRLRLARLGLHPTIVMPDTTSEEVIHGRLAEAEATVTIEEGPDVRDADDLEIVETGFPTWLTGA